MNKIRDMVTYMCSYDPLNFKIYIYYKVGKALDLKSLLL